MDCLSKSGGTFQLQLVGASTYPALKVGLTHTASTNDTSSVSTKPCTKVQSSTCQMHRHCNMNICSWFLSVHGVNWLLFSQDYFKNQESLLFQESLDDFLDESINDLLNVTSEIGKTKTKKVWKNFQEPILMSSSVLFCQNLKSLLWCRWAKSAQTRRWNDKIFAFYLIHLINDQKIYQSIDLLIDSSYIVRICWYKLNTSKFWTFGLTKQKHYRDLLLYNTSYDIVYQINKTTEVANQLTMKIIVAILTFKVSD